MLAAVLRHTETSICNQGESPLNTAGLPAPASRTSSAQNHEKGASVVQAPSLSVYHSSLL